MATQPLLKVDSVETYYGNIRALSGVSVDVNEGEIVALIGANGAGKSTLMKCIMGLLPCAAGSIRFAGKALSGRPVLARPSLGIGYSPEGRRVFAGLSVEEVAAVLGITSRSVVRDWNKARLFLHHALEVPE